MAYLKRPVWLEKLQRVQEIGYQIEVDDVHAECPMEEFQDSSSTMIVQLTSTDSILDGLAVRTIKPQPRGITVSLLISESDK